MNARKTIRDARNAPTAVEPLESRLLRTSIGITAAGVVQITGDGTNEYVEVQMVSATEFEVRAGPAAGSLAKVKRFGTVAGPAYPVAATSVAAYLGQGSDTLWTLPSAAPYPSFSLDMLVHADANTSAALKLAGGTDTVVTGDGSDTVYGYQGCDVINTGGGNDTVYGYDTPGSYSSAVGYNDIDTIDAGDGNDTVYGGPDGDFISGSGGDDTLHGNEAADQVSGGAGNDTLYGEGAHTIGGWEGADTLYGDGGAADTVEADDGYDQIYGGAGDDDVYGQGGGGMLSGEDGDDEIFGGGGADDISGGAGTDTAHGYGGNDAISGGSGGDTLHGDEDDDVLDGGSGGDTLFGDGGNDRVDGASGSDAISGDSGDDWLWGSEGGDTLCGVGGRDHLFGGSGTDLLSGGDEDDILVSIDDALDDTLYGDDGFDSFWVDRGSGVLDTGIFASSDAIADSDSEENQTNVHKVEAFANGADKSLDGDAIADPDATDYYDGSDADTDKDDLVPIDWLDFSASPLFADDGPTLDDVDQGSLGDCWLLAAMGAAAAQTPNAVYQLVADLGDGTYAVALDNDFYRVDADLPCKSGDTTPRFGGLGADGSTWVPIVEKAFTALRSGTYASLAGGNAAEAFKAFGASGVKSKAVAGAGSTEDVLDDINDALADGNGVVIGTYNFEFPDYYPLASQHAYTVVQVLYDGSTATGLIVRNPWGTDGPGDTPGTDGYLTISLDEFRKCAESYSVGNFSDFN
jgi:Ca2+-binding RTX toxin-like protein